MALLLGIDGGGTKTEAVLCDDTGTFLGRTIEGPTNPTSDSIELIHDRLLALLNDLLKNYQGVNTELAGYYAGIAGGGLGENQRRLGECLARLLPNVLHRSNGSDTVNSLNSGIGMSNGILVIAGTGSSVSIRINGKMRLISGWGYLLGDEGSGYEMGRMALMQALRAYDGRGAPTLLTRLCEERLGGPVADHIPRIYQEGRIYIASFAPLLSRAGEAGDHAAILCMEKSIQALAESIAVAGGQFPEPEKKTVITGGVFHSNPFMKKRLCEILGSSYHVIEPDLPPVYGSLLEAAKIASINTGREFEERYRSTSERK
ncbi:ATPase [Spirochaetia bacterium]|nr:ATPase [Spirochaetia bacterium]